MASQYEGATVVKATVTTNQSEHEANSSQGTQDMKLEVKVLKTVMGSGPFGEQTTNAKFYTLSQHPAQLEIPAVSANLQATRTDIDVGLGVLAFVVDGILTRSEADVLVSVSEAMGYSTFAPAIRTPPGMRQNKAAHWVASQHTANAFLKPMLERFRHLLPAEIDGSPLCPHLSHRFAHYKYDEGDMFNRHTDGSWPGQSVSACGNDIDEWSGGESKLTMLLYLSDEEDGVQGGSTRLFPFVQDVEPVDIAPKKGSALFFRHGFGTDSVHHMGTQVFGNAPKYVLRLNVLYKDAY